MRMHWKVLKIEQFDWGEAPRCTVRTRLAPRAGRPLSWGWLRIALVQSSSYSKR